MGSYYLNASNTQRYDGHDLLHAVLTTQTGPLIVGLKVRNVLDRAYAERADFAFGSFRYFPGQPRSVFVTLRYAPTN